MINKKFSKFKAVDQSVVVLLFVCCRRVNPFNQTGNSSASDGAAASAVADGFTFPVRFLGSQQVLTDRGNVQYRRHWILISVIASWWHVVYQHSQTKYF